jgi:hypothetical protein
MIAMVRLLQVSLHVFIFSSDCRVGTCYKCLELGSQRRIDLVVGNRDRRRDGTDAAAWDKLLGLCSESTDLLQSKYGVDRIFSRTYDVKKQKTSHDTEIFVKAFHVLDFIRTCNRPIVMRNGALFQACTKPRARL